MSYTKYWDNTTVRRVFSTESRQKAKDLFLQTHHPFCQIRVDFCKETWGERKFIN
jgi:hypothetical protein